MKRDRQRAWKGLLTTWAMSLVVIVGTGGCISIQQSNVPVVSTFPVASAKKTLDLDFSFSRKTAIRAYQDPVYVADTGDKAELERVKLLKYCIDRLRRSGLFADVSENVTNPDLRLTIMVEHMWDLNAYMAVIMSTGGSQVGAAVAYFLIMASPGIIPNWWSCNTYRLSAVLTDVWSGREFEIRLEDGTVEWIHGLFIPLMFAQYPTTEADQCKKKLFDNLAMEIFKTGLLEDRVEVRK